jgi:hypothetical protein
VYSKCLFLIYPLLAIFGIKKATEDEPLSMTMLDQVYSRWLCCSFMMSYGASKSPIKTPPILGLCLSGAAAVVQPQVVL